MADGLLVAGQKGIYAKLTGDAALTTLLGGAKVYDSPPENAVFPYVVIGDLTANDFGSATFRGQEQTLTIHSWSQEKSSLELKQIMDRIWSLLHQATLTLVDASLVLIRSEFLQPFLDEDGRTHHGVQRFRLLLKEG
jgi:hypothetical protein